MPGDDSIGTHRLLAAGEKMTEARLLWERWDQLDVEEMKAIVIAGVFDERMRKGMVIKLRECDEKKQRPQEVLKNFSDEWLEAVANSLHMVDREMGLSAVGSMVFSVHNTLPEWSLYNPDIIVGNFTNPGEFGYTTGIPGAGKTNFTCVQIELWLAGGRCVVSNIRIKGIDGNYYFARKFTTVLRAAIAIRRAGKTWFLCLDETGLYWLKAQAMRGTNIAMDKFLRILRKLGGSLIAIEQREEGISTTLQAFATQHFKCVKPAVAGVVNLDLHGPVYTHNIWTKGFPKTQLDFDTNALAYLEMDVDIDEIFEVLSGEDMYGDLERYLDRKEK